MTVKLSAIKHISFDFWNTIGSPNPDFVRARTWDIAVATNMGNTKTAEQKYNSTKKFLDAAAEFSGFGASAETCWKILNKQFRTPLDDDTLNALIAEVEQSFVKYPPIIPNELPGLIAQLSERGITCNILSNAHFVRGSLLKEQVVDVIFGKEAFLFQMYSDDYEMSKPNPDFFNVMLRNARFVDKTIIRRDVLHVGDSKINDIDGATKVGVDSLHVSSPTELVSKLTQLLTNGEVDW